MNRITNGIQKFKALITARIASGVITQSKVDDMATSLDMELAEYCKFQELKSLASMDGRLTLEEAQTVYSLLGNTPEHFNKQPVEVKYVLTEVFASLIKA